MSEGKDSADVVVIGAGLSGLMAAAFLARDGRDVVLLEQGAVAGGCLGGFTRQGFYFDAGAQSFESLGLLFPLLERLGLLDELEVERTPYRLRTPELDCSLSQPYDAITDAFCAAHRGLAGPLRRYFADVFRVARALERVTKPGRTPLLFEGAGRAWAIARFILGGPREAMALVGSEKRLQRDVAAQHLPEGRLREFLGTFGYRDTTLTNYAAFLACWRQDYWRPKRGTQRLVELLVDCCQRHGARLLLRTGAERIERRDGRVTGVRLADGVSIRAPVVLAACDHAHLERDLLGLTGEDPTALDVSDAFYTLWLGLDLSDEQLDEAFPEHHAFLVPKLGDCRLDAADPHAHRDRWIYVSRTSRGAPGLAPAGSSSLAVQTMTRADWADGWGRSADGGRSERYRVLKEQVEEELLDSLEALGPRVRPHIRVRFSGSPFTYQRYTRNRHGASAGWSWDPARAQPWMEGRGGLRPDIRTAIRGLYRCGHWTESAGSVPGAALSGFRAYRAILRDGR